MVVIQKTTRARSFLSNHKPILFILLFGLVGGLYVFFSSAATSAKYIEPETNTLTGNSSVVSDATASNSQYVLFEACPVGQTGTPPNCVTPPPAPTVTLTANPTSVTSGSSSTLTWSTTNATACTASGSWSGSKATSGSQSTGNLTSSQTYTLTCTGTGGSANTSAGVMVAGGVGTCTGTQHTPGGDDGMGGCWPGTYNTGYPHGLAGDTRTPVTLTNYTGSCTIAAGTNVTITGKNIDCSNEGLFVYGTLTLRNSKVKGVVYENSDNAVLTIEDTEIDGGNQTTFPTIGGARNITVRRVNAYGGQHTVMCYGNCVVENSWLHDQFEAGTEPHQNGFLSNDGSNYTIRHNTVHCTATGCTGDVSFTDDGLTTNATIDANLFMPTPGSYCIYPGTGPKNNPMYQFTVTNNVFLRGTNNKCGFYGPVYAWDTPNNNPGTTGYQNVWSNNKWSDGTVLNP